MHVSLGQIWADGEGPVITANGFIQLALRLEDGAEPAMIGRLTLVDQDCLADQFSSDFVTPGLVCDYTKKILAGCMKVIDCNNLAIDRLRLGKLSSQMQAKSFSEYVLKDTRRNVGSDNHARLDENGV